MSFDFLSNFFNFRRIGGVNAQATKILEDTEKKDEDKLKELLGLDFLKSAMTGVNADDNAQLSEFLCRAEIME
jgi:hypothetical protein